MRKTIGNNYASSSCINDIDTPFPYLPCINHPHSPNSTQILHEINQKGQVQTKFGFCPMTKSLLLLSVLLTASHLVASKQILGGWSPIKNVTDPHVKDLGAFAVSEHDKVANDSLVFVQVVSGEQQVVAGMNYRLVLEAKNGNGTVAKYVAVVWEKLWANTRQLTSFNPFSS
jgi:Aspartic acid proteinase inhibitor